MRTSFAIALFLLAATLLPVAVIADPLPPGPPQPGYICPFGYDPHAYANVCLTPGAILGPLPLVTTRCQNLVGNFTIAGYCQFVPAIEPGDGRSFVYVYADALCNQSDAGLTCHCLHMHDFFADLYICSGFIT